MDAALYYIGAKASLLAGLLIIRFSRPLAEAMVLGMPRPRWMRFSRAWVPGQRFMLWLLGGMLIAGGAGGLLQIAWGLPLGR